VGEVAGTGTDLGDYESSIVCSGDSSASSSDAGPLNVGQLGAGAVVDCTITNKRKPRVKVTKSLTAGDDGLFDLQVNGVTKKDDATDGGHTGYVNVAVGSNPTVGEVAGTPATNLSDYDSSIACSGDSTASSSNVGPLSLGTLAAGAVVDCTITNNRKARLAVVKNVAPTSGDLGTFDLRIDDVTRKQDAAHGDGTGFVNVANGTHAVSELNGTNSPNQLSDYESAITCDNGDTNTPAGGTSLTTSALGYGDKVTCTITNKRKPRVKVTKDLYPANDGGKFDLQVNGTTQKADAVDGQSTPYVNVAVGSNPTVGEIAGTGTDLADYESSITCAGDSTASSSNAGPLSVGQLSAGQVVDCTVTNERKPRVRVTKSLTPTTDVGKFNLQVNGTTKKADAGHGGTTDYMNVAVDSNPTVGETAGTGTSLADYESSIACIGDSTASSNDAGPLSVGQLSAGQSADCTITNKRKPEIKIVKKLDPATDDGRFKLKIDTTTFDNGGAGYGDGGTTNFQQVTAGSHTVAEAAHGTTSLGDYDSKVVCDSAKGATDPGTSHSFSVGYGDKVTCDITNKRRAIVTGVKYEDQNADGSKTGDSGLSGWTIKAYEDTNSNGAADAGEYRASATTGSGGAYSLSLSPRTYVICEVGQQNWAQTQPSPLTNNRCQGVSPARAGYLVEFSSGPIQADRDFGNTRLGSTSQLTNSAFQLVDDLTPWAIGDFEILLNPQNTIVATNPGQFYYHQRATNTTGSTTSMEFTLNWPCQFRTQTTAGQPLHAYVQLPSDPPDTWRDWTPKSSNISWTNNPCPTAGVGRITPNDVPPGAKVWVTAHLDYALKGTTAPSSKFGNPPITYGPFQSTIAVAGGSSYSSGSLLGRGKKVTLIYGRVSHKVGGDPMQGVWIRLTQGANTATARTDIGGSYVFYDGQACTTVDGLEGGCTGASTTTWTFASASTKLEALGDAAAAAATATWPAGKTNASVVSGSTVFATLTTLPQYTFSVTKGNAYNRDWKFGP
jgi:hypothetical protein